MKKIYLTIIVLFISILFSISFSGTQVQKIQSFTIMEGETLTFTANEGDAYYWYISDDSNRKYSCNADSASIFGVDFSGSTGKTLIIKSVKPKKPFVIISCLDREQVYGNRNVGKDLYMCFVVFTFPKKASNVSNASTASAVKSETFSSPVPKPEYNLTKTSVNPGETVDLRTTLSLRESVKGLITYQWYESVKADSNDAKAISDAISNTYIIDGNAHSGTIRYYFCKVTNELNGEKYSNDGIEMVEVTFAGQHVHAYSDWKAKTEPTCTENGEKTRTCECGDKQQVTISALGHTYGEWAIKTTATENAEGSEERTCTKCGAIETRVIPIIAVQSEISVLSEINSEVQANGQSTEQTKSEWWIVVLVLAGAACGVVYGLILVKKKKTIDNK